MFQGKGRTEAASMVVNSAFRPGLSFDYLFLIVLSNFYVFIYFLVFIYFQFKMRMSYRITVKIHLNNICKCLGNKFQ